MIGFKTRKFGIKIFQMDFVIETRTPSQWGAITYPHAQVFDTTATLKPLPFSMTQEADEHLLFVRTHTKFGIKMFEILHNNR